MDAVYIIVGVIAVLAVVFIKGIADSKAEKKALLKAYGEGYGAKRAKAINEKRLSELKNAFDKTIEENEEYIDDITFNDLELDKLLQAIDRTITYPGQESLYFILRHMSDNDELTKREELIGYFKDNEGDRLKVIELLLELKDLKSAEFIEYMDMLSECKTLSISKHVICLVLALAAICVVFIKPFAGFFLMIAAIVYNFYQYFSDVKLIRPYIYIFSATTQLLSYAQKLAKLNISAISDINEDIIRISDETKRLEWLFKIVIGRRSSFGGFVDVFFDCLKMFFHIDLLFFNTCLTVVNSRKEDYIGLWRYIGDVDAYISIGDYRASLPYYCVPDFSGEGYSALALYHPLIDNPVANDVDTKSCILLTGSNASGKSTFLKAVAVSALMAQTIHTVCAKEYRSKYFTIMTSMSLRDSIERSDSFYIAEIKSLKRIIDRSLKKDNLLICIDEILKGTNTYERISAAEAILRYFVAKNVICLGATHDLELAELLDDEYSNYHFTENVTNEGITFPYRLEEGITNTRNAIKLLDVMGFDEKIVAKATDNYNRICEEGIWK